MKRYLTLVNLFLILGLCVNIISCSSGSDGPEEPSGSVEILVNNASLQFDKDGGEAVVSVKSTADWQVVSSEGWCTVFPTGGLRNEEVSLHVKATSTALPETRTAILTINSGSAKKTIEVSQTPAEILEVSLSTVCFGAKGGESDINVTANYAWTYSVSDSWVSVSRSSGENNASLKISAAANETGATREAEISIGSGKSLKKIKVVQYSDEIDTPEGYTLVWNDEFNDPSITQPDLSKWYYDEWNPGFVNNELQRYVAGGLGNDRTADIENGILRITARKAGSQVISARLNTTELWTYGWFEARLKLPKGKGTWPAFWMMPANGGNWPYCGEIDIMEEVGTNPNYTSSSIHTQAYNHTIGTQKTAERLTPGAEDEFHVYALEWTPDYIKTYIDGKLLFSFYNDKEGRQETWPFDKPFHPILNLAWGGDWGGMNGVDESALPAVYEIDYVRIFQK